MNKNKNDIIVGTPYSNRHYEKQAREAIKNIKKELLDKIKPSPPEFSKTVDKYFWELI